MVFRNLGGGRFADVTAESGGSARPRSSRGAAFGDIDNDGDIDVLVMNMNEPPSLLRNDYRGPNHWLTIAAGRLRSTSPPSARVVVVTAADVTQARAVVSQSSYYSHDDLRLHFGLGAATVADRVDVRWPARIRAVGDERPRRSCGDGVGTGSIRALTHLTNRPALQFQLESNLSSERLRATRCRISLTLLRAVHMVGTRSVASIGGLL